MSEMQEREKRLEKIENHPYRFEEGLGPFVEAWTDAEDVNWLISELRAAWKREGFLKQALIDVAIGKGCEGYGEVLGGKIMDMARSSLKTVEEMR